MPHRVIGSVSHSLGSGSRSRSLARSRLFAISVSLTLGVGVLVAVSAAAAAAEPGESGVGGSASIVYGMPNQASLDLSASNPRTGGTPGWADVAGGVAARPYVTSLTVINNGVPTPVITNGTPSSSSVAPGGVTTAIAPFNLCRAGQTPAVGTCYSSPNRVAVTVGYSAGELDGYNFAEPSTTSGISVTPAINSGSIIDMTVALNTLGKSLRWAWVNGQLLYWQTSDLGHDNATVHIKFRPASAPWINGSHFVPGNGCTASPIFNCRLQSADGEVLSASMVLSLDETLDPSLTGAVFATENAIYGYLQPGGTPTSPSLEVQMSSSHTNSAGAPELGTLQAFIPAAALLHFYEVLPTDATSTFTTTRAGDAGTNNPPEYAPWTTAANGSEGLFVTVKGITFSVPHYKIADKLRPVRTRASAKRGTSTITASIPGCNVKSRCLASVYDLGGRTTKKYLATRTLVVNNRPVASSALRIGAASSKLKRGDRYLLVVHTAKPKRLLVSSAGTVS